MVYLHQKLYVFGGYIDSLTSKIDLYDMHNWTQVGTLSKGRSMIRALTFDDDKILLYDGREEVIKSNIIEIYSTTVEEVISLMELNEEDMDNVAEIFASIKEQIHEVKEEKKE